MRLILVVATTLVVAPEETSSGDIGRAILQALNAAKDATLNPAFAQAMPDPLSIDEKQSGKSDAGCIIPNPFGGCICHASAAYSVSLKAVNGLKGLHVTNFTSASVSSDMSTISLGADFAAADVTIDGGHARASVNACHISPSVSGSASTHARIEKARLIATGTGKVDMDKQCVKLSFNKITVMLDDISIHDTSVKIDLGPIPGLDVGKLVDCVTSLAPSLITKIQHAAQGPISKAITDVAANGDIPCIKIPSTAQAVTIV